MKIPPYVDNTPTRSQDGVAKVHFNSGRGGSAGRPLPERDKGRGIAQPGAGYGTAGASKSPADQAARAAAEKAAKRPPAFN
jgi:hypothetical protein